MDGRWLLLCLVAGAIAAIRYNWRAPGDASGTSSSVDQAPGAGGPRPSNARLLDSDPTGRDDRKGRHDRLGWHSRDATADPRDNPRNHVDHRRADDASDDFVGIDGIDEALDRVWSEHAGEAGTLLDARLRQIVRRGVPARAIRPAPGTRTARVVFADGTVLLCRGSGQGDFGRLSLALLSHSVRLGSYSREAGGTRLEFRWHPDQRLATVAVGLDQPD